MTMTTPTVTHDLDIPADLLAPSAYLAGSAGTGKTTLAREIVRQTRGTTLAATTGIAAVNLGEGTTINALLGYFDTASLVESHVSGYLVARLGKLWKAGLRRILLDEVSMLDAEQLTVITRAIDELGGRRYTLDADLADEVEAGMRAEGNDAPIAVTLIGDFAQLPPVKAPYAFESPEWERYAAHTHTLDHIHRQTDPAFVEALMAARVGDGATVARYFAPTLGRAMDQQFNGTTIFATNDAVARFNQIRMDRLPTPSVVFPAVREGVQRTDWKNVPDQLTLKEGALVMILANYREPSFEGVPGKLVYANGDLGTLTRLDPATGGAWVLLQRTNREVQVEWVVRENTVPIDAARKKELREQGKEDAIRERYEVVGSIHYLPLRVAYATTVHKCCSPDTWIRRGDALVPMGAVKAGDNLHLSGDVQAVATTQQRAYRLTTRRGYTIIASADHRWQTTTGWVSTREIAANLGAVAVALNVGDVLADPPYDAYAWWLGLTVGDGNYTHRKEGQIYLACLDRLLGDAWASEAFNLGANKVSWRKDGRGLHLTCRALRDQLEADGLGYVKGPSKRVPTIIWARGVSAWAAFLRGLFDADGSVGKSYVLLTTASQRLGEEVQELLLACGVVSTRTRYNGARDPYWQIRIDAEGLPAYAAVIGFVQRDKARKLAALTPNRIIRPSGGFDTVTAVEDLGLTLPMVDLEVAAPHVIGTGPFRSHNSQGLSLDAVQVNTNEGMFKTPGLLYVALSRARTAAGLRVIGSEAGLAARCVVNGKVRRYL